MSKKLVSILLCVVLVFVMAACGRAPAAPQETPESPVQTVQSNVDISTLEGWGNAVRSRSSGKQIMVAAASHPSTEAFITMTDEFTKLTGIEVSWDVVEETNLKTKQLLDNQGAGNYDVLMVDAFWMSEYASKNVLAPIEEYLKDTTKTPTWFDYEDIMPAFRNGIAGANGVNYGVPIAGETRFIAYRTDLFDKYDKTPPETMKEFLELAQFFTGREQGLYGVSMRAQRGIHFASGWMSLMYNFGGGFIDQATIGEGKDVVITASSPETIESLQFFIDLLKCAPRDVGTFTHEEALGAFMAGNTAMWLDATALANQITNPSSSKIADKVAFVPTPTGPAGDGAALAGWSLAISQESSEMDEAWAFIVFMASKEKSIDYVKAGGIATRYSTFQNEELAKLNPSFGAQKEALISANGLVERGLSWIPQHEQINQILEIAGTYGSLALAGRISVIEAIEKIQEDSEDLIN